MMNSISIYYIPIAFYNDDGFGGIDNSSCGLCGRIAAASKRRNRGSDGGNAIALTFTSLSHFSVASTSSCLHVMCLNFTAIVRLDKYCQYYGNLVRN